MDDQSKQNLEQLEEKAQDAAEQQREDLILDFDAAKAEYDRQHQPIQVKVGGETYQLPPEIPFTLFLFYQRHCLSKREGKTVFEVPDDRVLEFLELMFGEGILTQLEQSDLTFEFVMQKVAPRIMERWGYGAQNGQKKTPTIPD